MGGSAGWLRLAALAAALLLVGAGGPADSGSAHPNVVLLIADDLGVDWAPCYADFSLMPNVAALCERGVVFDTVWSNPSCTPTRASVLTGRFALRHRAGASTDSAGADTRRLRTDEVTLPELLDRIPGARYRNAAVGKWHLDDPTNGGPASPVTSAFQSYYGTPGGSYFLYQRNVDGVLGEWRERYLTSAIVDDAIAWLDTDTDKRPWLLWVAFFNAHFPYHLPPKELHDFDFLEFRQYGVGGPRDTHALPSGLDERVPEARPYYAAQLQAMDTEIGRLLRRIEREERPTWVIFLGDNGTPVEVDLSGLEGYRFKGTVYEGGVRVPLVIAGPGVVRPGRRVPGLVNVSDVFATVAELAGGSAQLAALERRLDSVSLVPYLHDTARGSLRPWIYTERGAEVEQFEHAVRDARFKLILKGRPLAWLPLFGNSLELYDLAADPREQDDLVGPDMSEEQRAAAARLFRAFEELLASEPEPFTNVDMEALRARARELGLDVGEAAEPPLTR